MIIAFHGEPSLKQAVMDRLYEHKRLEQIIQGVYWEHGRGCHLGCITHADDDWHEEAERLFGIEQRIGYWLEVVFEKLHEDECARWVIESTEAIPCGANMSKCHHHFLSWLLLESGLLTVTRANREVIETVGNLHRRAITGEVTPVAWSKWAAAARAAWAPAALAAAEWSAARAAAWAVAEWSAESTWRKIAAKSIEIFAAAPVVAGSVEPAIERELCCRNLWCREGNRTFELAGVGNG